LRCYRKFTTLQQLRLQKIMDTKVMIRRSVLVSGFSLTLLALQTVQAQTPSITAGGVVNAASFDPGKPLAAGSLVAIFGTQLAAGLAQADTVPLSTSLTDVSVAFNGVAAPLDFVSAGQINAQIPYEVLPPGTSGTVNVTVTRSGAVSAPEPIVINQVAPGVFTSNGHAIAIIATDPKDPRYGMLAAPAGSIPGLTTSPAHTNDVLIVYATGLGTVNPPVLSGHDSLDQLRSTTLTPTVLVGNVASPLFFSGLTPQYPGVYQLNIGVPQIAPGNAVPLQVQVSGITSPATATIAISAT
jgi:uncharacterized protein (TIGR03437 family)